MTSRATSDAVGHQPAAMRPTDLSARRAFLRTQRFNAIRIWLIAGVAMLVIAGCSENSSKNDALGECVPGQVVSCECNDGMPEGIRICNDDGIGYSDCFCIDKRSGDSDSNNIDESTDGQPDTDTWDTATETTDTANAHGSDDSDSDTTQRDDTVSETETDTATTSSDVSTDTGNGGDSATDTHLADTTIDNDSSDDSDTSPDSSIVEDSAEDTETATAPDTNVVDSDWDTGTATDTNSDSESESESDSEDTDSCSGCLISQTCYPEGTANPTNECEACLANYQTETWTVLSGTSCDDGEFCNGDDVCDAGVCAQHSGAPCSASQVCDVSVGACCTLDAYLACNSDGDVVSYDSCDNATTVVADCLPASENGSCSAGACSCSGHFAGAACDECALGWHGQNCDQCVIYVDASTGSDMDSGNSWPLAKATIQDAIHSAAPNGCALWVAAGTYYPTETYNGTTARHRSIQMATGVDMYGGFLYGDIIFEDRNPSGNETILSGDVDEDGTTDGNAFKIIVGADNATLDGFTVTGASIIGAEVSNDIAGGAMYNDGVSPTIQSCIFSGNVGGDYTDNHGGVAMFNSGSAAPVVRDSVFIDNTVDIGNPLAGAVYNTRSSPVFEDCHFENNYAPLASGGAMHNFYSTTAIRGCSFRNNFAGSGAAVWNANSTVTIENSRFSLNKASGGGPAVINSYWESNTLITNSTFTENITGGGGTSGGVFAASMDGILTVTNSTFFGNLDGDDGTASISRSYLGSSLTFRNNLVWTSFVDTGAINTGTRLFLLEDDATQRISYSNIEAYCTPQVDCTDGNTSALPLLTNVPQSAFRTTGDGSTTELTVENLTAYYLAYPGDIIEIEDDGVARTVTALDTDLIRFTPALADASTSGMHVYNWKSNSNVELDLHLLAASPCIDAANGNYAPMSDLDGSERADDPTVANTGTGTPVADMGAYEYTGDGNNDTDTGDTDTGDTDTGDTDTGDTNGTDTGSNDTDTTAACITGTFDDDGNPSTPCVPWQDCEAGTFIATEGTDTTDRICQSCSINSTTLLPNQTSCDLVRYSDISAQLSHTCGIREHDGVMQCWGFNYYHQSVPPADIAVTQISAGAARTCGIRADNGEAICFGQITSGTEMTLPGVRFSQLDVYDVLACGIVSGGANDGHITCFGFGEENPMGFPDDVTFSKVVQGFGFGCAQRADNGEVVCVGAGHAVTDQAPTGVAFLDIDVGYGHACGVRADNGSIQCWGENDNGQLNVPVSTSGETIYAGLHHTCALTSDGSATCWGDNANGELDVPEGLRFSDLAPGNGYTCGLVNGGDMDGRTVCWGNDEYGGATPPEDEALLDITSSWYLTCARVANGEHMNEARCWGNLGAPGYEVPSDFAFAQIAAGYYHVCGLDTAGTPQCFGRDESGETSPLPGVQFTDIDGAYFYTCGIRMTDSTPLCFGDIAEDGLDMPPSGPMSQITTGQSFACGIFSGASAGLAGCWGNENAVLNSVPTTTLFEEISAGVYHVCGIVSGTGLNGNVECWGSDADGVSTPPTDVNFATIAAGAYHNCGVVSGGADDGKVMCWGDSDYYKLAAPDMRFSDVTAGLLQSCGIREEDGIEVCWGAIVRNLWQE